MLAVCQCILMHALRHMHPILHLSEGLTGDLAVYYERIRATVRYRTENTIVTQLCSATVSTLVKANRTFRIVAVMWINSVGYFYFSILFDIIRIEA